MNRLDKIEARTNAATEGPWEWDGESNEPWPAGDNSLRSVSGAKDDLVLYAWGYDAYGIEAARDADAEFIANARVDVPRLLAAVRAVEAIADELCEDIPEDAANASMKHAGKVIRRALTKALEGEK